MSTSELLHLITVVVTAAGIVVAVFAATWQARRNVQKDLALRALDALQDFARLFVQASRRRFKNQGGLDALWESAELIDVLVAGPTLATRAHDAVLALSRSTECRLLASRDEPCGGMDRTTLMEEELRYRRDADRLFWLFKRDAHHRVRTLMLGTWECSANRVRAWWLFPATLALIVAHELVRRERRKATRTVPQDLLYILRCGELHPSGDNLEEEEPPPPTD